MPQKGMQKRMTRTEQSRVLPQHRRPAWLSQLPGHWLVTRATETHPQTACGHPAECFHGIMLLKFCLNDAMEIDHAQCVFPSFGFPNGQVINSSASEPAQFWLLSFNQTYRIIIRYSAFLCVRREDSL